MKLFISSIFICCLGASLAPLGHAQTITIMLSTTFDDSDRSLYAYAATTVSGYDVEYSYATCTQMSMEWWNGVSGAGAEGDGWLSGGPWTNCAEYGGDTEVDHTVTLPTWADYYEADGNHTEVIDYYDYQFDEGCSEYCYDYWDADEISLTDAGGWDGWGGNVFSLPGPPGVPVPYYFFQQQTTIYVYGNCGIPTGETSEYRGIFYPGDPGYVSPSYAGKFKGHLLPSSQDFGGRFVKEAVTLTSKGCRDAYPNTTPATNLPAIGSLTQFPSEWGVFSPYVDGMTPGSYYADDSNPDPDTGLLTWADKIGISAGLVDWYQNQLGFIENNIDCNIFTSSQQMMINACTSPFGAGTIPYDTHDVSRRYDPD